MNPRTKLFEFQGSAFLRQLVAAASAVMALTAVLPASAFCRITTCNPDEDTCVRDADGCSVAGSRVYWASGCVSLAFQKDGSRYQAIDAEELEELSLVALRAWLEVDCGGGEPPSIGVQSLGTVECNEPEYNASGNANIVIFEEESWDFPDGPDALARTRLTFDPQTGRLFDGDIVINGVEGEFTTGEPAGEADLLAVLTHEIGHFLGLDHSLEDGATMVAGYSTSDTGIRSLSDDDIAGICAIYPPDRNPSSQSCTPRNGFASDCRGNDRLITSPPLSSGCRFAPPSRSAASAAGVLLLFLLGAVRFVRPRVARNRRAKSSATVCFG